VPRLVIPADQTPDDLAPYGDGDRTWQEVAGDNGCDAVEVFGSAWCVDHVDGLGIVSDYVAPPPPSDPPAPIVDASAVVATLTAQLAALAVDVNGKTTVPALRAALASWATAAQTELASLTGG
jgi:hypothetical protein